MAEETPEHQEKKGGGIVKLAIIGVLLIVAAGGGFATYTFLIAPKLAPEDEAEMSELDEPGEYIPVAPVMVDFDDNFSNVIMEDPNLPASTLMYAVTLECNNQLTADLIMANMARFADMIAKLHDSRMRSELDDLKTLKNSIQNEIRQKSNAMLRQLQGGKGSEDILVTNVFHRTMIVDDKL